VIDLDGKEVEAAEAWDAPLGSVMGIATDRAGAKKWHWAFITLAPNNVHVLCTAFVVGQSWSSWGCREMLLFYDRWRVTGTLQYLIGVSGMPRIVTCCLFLHLSTHLMHIRSPYGEQNEFFAMFFVAGCILFFPCVFVGVFLLAQIIALLLFHFPLLPASWFPVVAATAVIWVLEAFLVNRIAVLLRRGTPSGSKSRESANVASTASTANLLFVSRCMTHPDDELNVIRVVNAPFTKLPLLWMKVSVLSLSYDSMTSSEIASMTFAIGLSFYSLIPIMLPLLTQLKREKEIVRRVMFSLVFLLIASCLATIVLHIFWHLCVHSKP